MFAGPGLYIIQVWEGPNPDEMTCRKTKLRLIRTQRQWDNYEFGFTQKGWFGSYKLNTTDGYRYDA